MNVVFSYDVHADILHDGGVAHMDVEQHMIVVHTDVFRAVSGGRVFNSDIERRESFRIHAVEERLVCVEDQNAALFHAVDDFHLCIADSFAGAEVFQMGASDIGDDCDIGFGNAGQIGDLSFMIHSHFEEKRLMVGVEIHNGQRETDFVIEISFGDVRRIFCFEDGKNKLFGRGFSDASRYGKRDRTKQVFIGAGKFAEGFRRIFDDDTGDRAVFGNVFHDGKHTACLFGGRNEAVTVKIFSSERKKRFSLLRGTGVDGDSVGEGSLLLRCRAFDAFGKGFYIHSVFF